MLPVIRSDEHLYVVPKFDLGKDDIKIFMHELKGFHEQFHDCFQRSESREHFLTYMAGQFGSLERKSMEPIALAVKDGNVRTMQRFVSDAPWDDDKIITKYRNFVNDDLGSPDGALIFDESGFVKKGRESIGVAKQYCGTIGKIENCQVGVFAAYASFTRRRVILGVDGLPQKTVWLLIRRTLDDDPEYSYFISNASASIRLQTLVWPSGLRWAIEQCVTVTIGPACRIGPDECGNL